MVMTCLVPRAKTKFFTTMHIGEEYLFLGQYRSKVRLDDLSAKVSEWHLAAQRLTLCSNVQLSSLKKIPFIM